MTDLKPCPCGETPAELCVTDSGSIKWGFVYGGCCGAWHVEFRTRNASGDKLMEYARVAWNDAPRAKP